MALTLQQQSALDAIGKTTTVSAGAGTGKTSTMVERYLGIVRRTADGSLPEALRCSVGGILTITFTDDAASELKRRLISRLTELEMAAERREVETAYISTIHAFCMRLLKENPFEAGLDPQFAMLTAGENALILETAFEQIVDEGFLQSSEEIMGLFRTFATIRRFGDPGGDAFALLRREAAAACELLRSRGWRPGKLRRWLHQGPEGILAANMAATAGHLRGLLNALGNLCRGMDRLRVTVECQIEEARVETLALLSELEADLQPMPGRNLTPEGCRAICGRLVEIRKLAGKTHGRKGADPEVLAELKDRLRKIAALLDPEMKLLNSFDPVFEEESARQSYWLLYLVDRLWERHSGLKRAEGRLDYNDLQSFARDLLIESRPTRDRYRRRLRHIMVDEFQDTDGLQKQIVDLLRTRNNLFCVGDPKQSIYGFRNADVTLFNKLIRSVKEGAPEEHAHVVLGDNFRSRPEIIGFVNHVFRQLGVGEGIDYETLESRAPFCAREDPSIELLLAPDRERDEEKPPPGHSAPAKPTKQALEADLVARRIRQMVDQGMCRITAEGDRQGDPVQFKDFLILLRTFTPLREYERALAKHDVDYYVIGGRGYYAQREIRDIANLLKVIQNPLNDVALAAALRSPFCGLSDEALYTLARWGQRTKLPSLHAGVLEALHRAAAGTLEAPSITGKAPGADFQTADLQPSDALSHEDAARLIPFWNLVEGIRRKEDRTRIATILEELLAETLYEARLLMQPGGRRKMANVRKLVVHASQRNTCGVSDFLRWLDQLSRVVEKEGEAPTEEEAANVVRIRTIHNAKGLEGNVVIVGGLSQTVTSSVNQRPCFLFDVRTGAGCCQYPSAESFQTRQSAAYAALLRARERREIDESLRLLYVAMTRARECLILAGSGPGKGETWASRLLPCLNVPGGIEGDLMLEVCEGVQVAIRTAIPGHRRQTAAARLVLQKIQAQMRAQEPLDPSDLQNLERLIPNA